jgi:hypothetical protein
MLRTALLTAISLLALEAAPCGAALWQAEREWSEAEEAGFAAFVEAEVDPDFFVRAGLAHDCADILYGLRWIYARERGLPAAASAVDGGLVGHWSARFGPVNRRRSWTRDANFLAALRFVFGMTGTRTLPADTYPVAVDREHVRAGVVYREENHAYVVAQLVLDGTEPHPLVTWESTMPPAVRPLRNGVFAPSAPQAGSGDGLRRFRWVEKARAGWQLVPLERQPGYSEEQFSTAFVEGHPFAESVARRLEPEQAPPIVQVLRYMAQVERLARERVPIVLAGYRACAKSGDNGACREGGALWELYSTPNRDARMLGYLARVRALVEAREVEPEWVLDLMRAKGIDVGAPLEEGDSEAARRIDLTDLYYNARFVSSEPGDEITKRWGRAVCESLGDRIAAIEASLAFLRERSSRAGDDYAADAIESRELELAELEEEREVAGCAQRQTANTTPISTR